MKRVCALVTLVSALLLTVFIGTAVAASPPQLKIPKTATLLSSGDVEILITYRCAGPGTALLATSVRQGDAYGNLTVDAVPCTGKQETYVFRMPTCFECPAFTVGPAIADSEVVTGTDVMNGSRKIQIVTT